MTPWKKLNTNYKKAPKKKPHHLNFFFVRKCVKMRKEIRVLEVERGRENELTQLGTGKWYTLPHLNQASVISYLMAFAAPTVLPTLQFDSLSIVSNCFSTVLGNKLHSRHWQWCNKSAMLKSQGAHTSMLYVQVLVG